MIGKFGTFGAGMLSFGVTHGTFVEILANRRVILKLCSQFESFYVKIAYNILQQSLPTPCQREFLGENEKL